MSNDSFFGFFSKVSEEIASASSSVAESISDATKTAVDSVSKTTDTAINEVSSAATNSARTITEVTDSIVVEVSSTAKGISVSLEETYESVVNELAKVDIKGNLKPICEHIDFDKIIFILQKKIDNEHDSKKKLGLMLVVKIMEILNNAKKKEWNIESVDNEIKEVMQTTDFKVVWLIVQPLIMSIPAFGPVLVGIVDFYLFFYA